MPIYAESAQPKSKPVQVQVPEQASSASSAHYLDYHFCMSPAASSEQEDSHPLADSSSDLSSPTQPSSLAFSTLNNHHLQDDVYWRDPSEKATLMLLMKKVKAAEAGSAATPFEPQATSPRLQGSLDITPSRPFVSAEILQDPQLADAARQQLGSRCGSTGLASPAQGNCVGGQVTPVRPSLLAHACCAALMGDHSGDVERQRQALEQLDLDIQDESGVAAEISGLIVKQLEGSSRMLSGLVKLVHGLASAESAYVAALRSTSAACAGRALSVGNGATAIGPSCAALAKSRSPVKAEDPALCGEQAQVHGSPNVQSESSLVVVGLAALSKLPDSLTASHGNIATSLARLAQQLQRLLHRFQATCRDVRDEFAALNSALNSGRRALDGLLKQHAAACEEFDQLLQLQAEGQVVRGPQTDPWAAEALLVQEQQGLQRWQDKERSFLNTAFSQAKDLEAARLELVHQVLATASEVYQAAALPLQPELQRMAQACAAPCVWGTLGADQAGQQLSELTKAAATASEAAGMLAARQAESMQAASAELFCSPEIVCQGPLELWEEAAGRWQPGHAVLTRAGFLHWLRGDGCLPPACSIALARAQLESSQPPLITLNAGPSQQAASWGVLGSLLGALRVRRLTLRAPSTDSCCEWVLAVREAAAGVAGRAQGDQGLLAAS
ncbi:hypothetical protein QJQ45_025386 [Haematococcus lacustris]|nr:hypothetical protein QJQ45_025386 [Haematococcus lacustris]